MKQVVTAASTIKADLVNFQRKTNVSLCDRYLNLEMKLERLQ